MCLQVIAGRDPLDSTSADVPVADYVSEIGRPVKGSENRRAGGILRRRSR